MLLRRTFLPLTKLKPNFLYRLRHQHHYHYESLESSLPLLGNTLKTESLDLKGEFLLGMTKARKKSEIIMPKSGKPSVTKAYMSACSEKPTLLKEPQNLLVILDLNGTLLYRLDSRKTPRFIARPQGLEFLEKCVEKFYVVVWSSAGPEKVKMICNSFIPPLLHKKVIAIWGRDKLGLSPKEYRLRVQCYKRLTHVWNDVIISKSHPEYSQGARWNQTNTVLIDDSTEKGLSEPYNLIKIPEFMGDINEPGEVLLRNYDYLCHLSMYSNVSSYLRHGYPAPKAEDNSKIKPI